MEFVDAGGVLDRSAADIAGLHTWDYLCNICVGWMIDKLRQYFN